MSKSYDKYIVQPSSSVKSYDKYIVQPTQSNTEVARKALASGVISLVDLPQNMLSFFQDEEDIARGEPDISSFTPLSSRIKGGLKEYGGIDLEPKPTGGFQRGITHAGEFAGSMGPWGFLSKTAKGANLLNKAVKVGKSVGTNTLLGGAIGGTSSALQENDIITNPLAADMIASVLAPTTLATRPKHLYSAFQKTGETAAKIPMKLMGLGPKGLNIEATQAARDLGIDLPAAALTNSKLTGHADQLIGKAPLFGEELGKKYANAEKQTKNVLEKIYEEVGPKKTPEVNSEIHEKYKKSKEFLPEGATFKPTKTLEAIDKVEFLAPLKTDAQKKLLGQLQELKEGFNPSQTVSIGGEKFSPGVLGKSLPIPENDIRKLIDQKVALNELISWDTPVSVKDNLKKVRSALVNDLEDYGKTNPEWYKSFKEADELYANVAKREKLETQLGSSINPKTNELNYGTLSGKIHEPKQLELIKKRVTPEIFAKIEKLGIVARAMALKNRGIPNPSGTASTKAILGLIPGFIYAPLSTTTLIAGAAGMTKLLTDKKFLDLALKYAEKPNMLTSMPLNKRVKDVTGKTATVLNREMNRTKEEE